MTDSGREVYRYAVAILLEADRAESAIRNASRARAAPCGFLLAEFPKGP